MPGVSNRSAIFITFIILLYLAIGTLFAVHTPAWQSPDEPAHYNYVRYLAEQGRLPVLQDGDFPLEYLEEIKRQQFPPELDIDPIRYEFHQPPLYYLLATPLFKLFGGALLPLRLLSVVLGAALIYVAFRVALTLCPARPALALGTAAFVAFVPMHVAITAAMNNDTLSELLLALALWGLLLYLRGENIKRLPVITGLLLGLALLTKMHALIGMLTAVIVVTLHRRREPRRAARELAWLLVPALLLALPWLTRNVIVYGWPDVMGLARHDEVVLGQPTTAEWIADYGWGYVLREGLRTTYHSFWGKFGWMAVPMDRRIYLALGLFSAVALLGFIAASISALKKKQKLRALEPSLALVLWALLTFISYLWYNTKFVQHQGRYLFPALVPLGLAVAVGWRMVTRRAGVLLFALPYAGLALLDVLSLFVFVVPYL